MFTAAVVGLGNIGQLYDYDDTDGSRLLTHANGFFQHPKFRLIAGVDENNEAREKFEAKFRCPAFASISALYERFAPDVVSIAVPTGLHYKVFKEIIGYGPQGILCEKPVAQTLAEGMQMKALAEQKKCTVLINYMRRFEPGVEEIRQMLQAGAIGDIYKGVMWYSKGILNNGSHFIDLLSYLLGPVKKTQILARGGNYAGDPEPDLQIWFGDTCVYFLAGKEECFSVKELELMGTLGTLQYLRGGEVFKVRKTMANPLFPAYTILEQKGTCSATQLGKYQKFVLDDFAASLEEKRLPLSNLDTALETLSVIEMIQKQMCEED